MTGHRIRLDEDERVYLMDLVLENNKLQGSLMSSSIKKLLKKLGDDSQHPTKARAYNFKHFECLEEGCGKTARSGAGLDRHTVSRHGRKPTELERQSDV